MTRLRHRHTHTHTHSHTHTHTLTHTQTHTIWKRFSIEHLWLENVIGFEIECQKETTNYAYFEYSARKGYLQIKEF